MRQQVYLHIPEPCHENWEAMSTAAQGRFCQSCSKQVIDFSGMSDTQILTVLSQAAGNTCGRFTGNQLERPLANEIPYFLQPVKALAATLIPVLLVVTSVAGQEVFPKGDFALKNQAPSKPHPTTIKTKPVQPEVHPQQMMTVGMILPRLRETHYKQPSDPKTQPGKKVTVKGRETGTDLEPLPHANLRINNHDRSPVADGAGNFPVAPEPIQQASNTRATHAGYRHDTVQLEIKKVENEIKVFPEPIREPDHVITTAKLSQPCTFRLGEISIVKTTTPKDTAHAFVQKLFNHHMFNAFPNPAVKGQSVHLRFKQAGTYSIQLFDNGGRLYHNKELQVYDPESVYSYPVPASLSAGTYYLKAVDMAAKNQFIEKIVVQ